VPDVTITVRGDHEVSRRPERATVRLRVDQTGPARDAVVSAAAGLARSISDRTAALHDAERGPVTWWASDRLNTWTERPTDRDGRPLAEVHHAVVDLAVRFSDFDVLSTWLTETAGLADVNVHSIEWSLTDRSRDEAIVEARRAAVADAQGKAAVYADSLGCAGIEPVALADAGLLHDSPPTPGPRPMAMRAAAFSSGEQIAFMPQDVVVNASVEARFRAH
jgi:uncharacterized protein YggE